MKLSAYLPRALPAGLEILADLATDLRWTWSHEKRCPVAGDGSRGLGADEKSLCAAALPHRSAPGGTGRRPPGSRTI